MLSDRPAPTRSSGAAPSIRLPRALPRVSLTAVCLLVTAACAASPRTTNLSVGAQQFRYDIPPVVNPQTVGTVAVLMPTTAEAARYLAELEREINRQLPDARVIDSRRLDEIVRERQLLGNAGALERVGELLDVDLFVAADPYVDTESVIRLIARDDRVLAALRVVGGPPSIYSEAAPMGPLFPSDV